MCETNILITKLNCSLDLTLPLLGGIWTKEWYDEACIFIKDCNKALVKCSKLHEVQQIKNRVDQRCEYIATNCALVNSLMNKSFHSIKLDITIVLDEEGELMLITEPEELKQQCDKEYSKMFKK